MTTRSIAAVSPDTFRKSLGPVRKRPNASSSCHVHIRANHDSHPLPDCPDHGLCRYHRGRAAAKNFNRMRPFAQDDKRSVSTGVLNQAIDLSNSIFEYSKE